MRWVPSPARFWALTAAAALGVLMTMALGFWQLSRAADKLALQAAISARQTLGVLDSQTLADAMGDSTANPDILYRAARLRGAWLHRHTVFLDNRQMHGKPGFFVLTPLRLESGPTVVVQRGWVRRNFTERAAVPEVPTPGGVVEVAGRIAPPPSKLYEFEASHGGVIRQNLDLAQFSQEIALPLVNFSVLQLGPPADGLERDWPPIHTGIEKHYGYAFQWFALCGLIAFLYGWFQIVRRFISSH